MELPEIEPHADALLGGGEELVDGDSFFSAFMPSPHSEVFFAP
jgi:hypothetical protein